MGFGVPYLLFVPSLSSTPSVRVCADGAAMGIIAPYRFLLSTLKLPWQVILWFALSGATAGAAVGFFLRQGQKVPKLRSQP